MIDLTTSTTHTSDSPLTLAAIQLRRADGSTITHVLPVTEDDNADDVMEFADYWCSTFSTDGFTEYTISYAAPGTPYTDDLNDDLIRRHGLEDAWDDILDDMLDTDWCVW